MRRAEHENKLNRWQQKEEFYINFEFIQDEIIFISFRFVWFRFTVSSRLWAYCLFRPLLDDARFCIVPACLICIQMCVSLSAPKATLMDESRCLSLRAIHSVCSLAVDFLEWMEWTKSKPNQKTKKNLMSRENEKRWNNEWKLIVCSCFVMCEWNDEWIQK